MEFVDIGFVLLIVILLGVIFIYSIRGNGIGVELEASVERTKKRKPLPIILVILLLSSAFFYSQYYNYKSSNTQNSDRLILSKSFKINDFNKLNSVEKLKMTDSLNIYEKQLSALVSKLSKQEFITGKKDSVLLQAKARLILLRQAEVNIITTDLNNQITTSTKNLLTQNSPIDLLLQRQQYDRIKFWAVAVIAGLLLIVNGLLISNVKRKARTNEQLTNLNAEVSRQKDNLDRINHHLEEIIDERTKDLQIKNKKLSETVNNLIFQITKPFYNFKGILDLKNDELINLDETSKMMNSSLEEINDFISNLREDVNKAQQHQ